MVQTIIDTNLFQFGILAVLASLAISLLNSAQCHGTKLNKINRYTSSITFILILCLLAYITFWPGETPPIIAVKELASGL